MREATGIGRNHSATNLLEVEKEAPKKQLKHSKTSNKL